MPRWSISPSWSSAKASHGVLGRHRAGRLAAIGVALVHRDAAEVVLERLHRVEHGGRPIADPRVQAAAGGDQQREAGAGLLVADADVAFFVERHGSFSLHSVMSADGVEHDDRDLALGLLLVIGVGRPELERLFPQPRALLAGGGPGPRLHLRGADLHLDLRVGEDVAVPAGVLRRAAFRGDDDIAVAGLRRRTAGR